MVLHVIVVEHAGLLKEAAVYRLRKQDFRVRLAHFVEEGAFDTLKSSPAFLWVEMKHFLNQLD